MPSDTAWCPSCNEVAVLDGGLYRCTGCGHGFDLSRPALGMGQTVSEVCCPVHGWTTSCRAGTCRNDRRPQPAPVSVGATSFDLDVTSSCPDEEDEPEPAPYTVALRGRAMRVAQ